MPARRPPGQSLGTHSLPLSICRLVAARPRTLPPVVLRMVQDTAQMGSMRCQLKSQIDAEVVEALMELVNSDRTPSKPLRGMSSVTGACLVRPQCRGRSGNPGMASDPSMNVTSWLHPHAVAGLPRL